jgi:SAM-dependent methyltransferase
MTDRGNNEWDHHAEWWLAEVEDDPIYRSDVIPLLMRMLAGVSGKMLDLGCGEGQVMALFPGRVIGCDISSRLLERAAARGPVVRAELPDLGWLRTESVDAAYLVLVVEHLRDLDVLVTASRVVRAGGTLALVMNHPAFTAAGSGPILDQTDGEILWRWGDYFEAGTTMMAAKRTDISFHHRPLATILNTAAAAGWKLEELVETGFSEAALATEPGYVGQEQMPRLLGARWSNTQGSRGVRR